ncbi:MAG: hypothetical protein ISS57_02265 [Anaerolineales bacterium]|nr:hypothetical protein [Chloroflexota bacterium]MBL7161401.1 hypothetical protein [Anaerolineales bacterium]
MKGKFLSKCLILGILLFSLLLTGCSGGDDAAEDTQASVPKVYSNLTLQVSPDTNPNLNIALTKGALIQMSAHGFTPKAKFRVYLGATGTDYKDPVATGKTDAEGKTTTFFSIPQQWDDGQPITQDELLIMVESGEGGESLTLKIGYLNE